MKSIIELNETNFDSEVLQSPQPVLVDFWAEWCGPCKALAPVLEEIAQEQGTRIKIAKVNVDTHPGLAQRFRIQAVPALLYFAGGRLREQTVGLATKRALVAKLQNLAAPESATANN